MNQTNSNIKYNKNSNPNEPRTREDSLHTRTHIFTNLVELRYSTQGTVSNSFGSHHHCNQDIT